MDDQTDTPGAPPRGCSELVQGPTMTQHHWPLLIAQDELLRMSAVSVPQ